MLYDPWDRKCKKRPLFLTKSRPDVLTKGGILQIIVDFRDFWILQKKAYFWPFFSKKIGENPVIFRRFAHFFTSFKKCSKMAKKQHF